jgi:hypothetical protein
MVLAAVSLALSVLAILISLTAAYYSKRQTEIMEAQESRREREEWVLIEWRTKFDKAVRAVLSIGFSKLIQLPTWQSTAYGTILPSAELRQRIETYLVHQDGRFMARALNDDVLRSQIVQTTITEVLEAVERFKVSDPDNARKLSLL